ncbi:glycoside hydrolase family 99-like domain-containing protein [uncultured Bacteroides sp.]|uniref:glycosyltransferase WbsX family protein n=1 Tax=uncultured Bacteroides sp. TaxID=162156 RepID=UPI0035A65A9C
MRTIAFYLPQFFPTKENDEWWEPGFTEWTNVVRATPLYKGHYQPRIPRDLSFYDLRVPETRKKQAFLAQKAGIEGFCYWHYWFGNGKRLLDRVFREVVESGQPNYPFCLCWANHSWYKKTWDPTKPNTLLIEQTYPGVEDYIAHFNEMLPAFKDHRYMKVDGRLIFGIFAPLDIPNVSEFIETWNLLAKENGLSGFYFFALSRYEEWLDKLKELPYDAIVLDTLPLLFWQHHHTIKGKLLSKMAKMKLATYRMDYDYYKNKTIDYFNTHCDYTPCIIPDFDHSPRSAKAGIILHGSTPEKFADLTLKIKSYVESHSKTRDLLFIKAWNEWGEGNYLEPDSKWKSEYLEYLGKILNK